MDNSILFPKIDIILKNEFNYFKNIYISHVLYNKEYKKLAIEKIEKHIEWLEPLDSISRATGGYKGIINFLNQTDNSHLLSSFFKDNDPMDQVRNESFEEVFPEYLNLRSYVS